MALWQVVCDPLRVREPSGGKTSALRGDLSRPPGGTPLMFSSVSDILCSEELPQHPIYNFRWASVFLLICKHLNLQLEALQTRPVPFILDDLSKAGQDFVFL